MWAIIDRLADIILESRPGPIVEIGVGRSTKLLARYAQDHGVKLYSCDILHFKPQFADHVCFVGPSFTFMDQFQDTPALVLLDGCHDYTVVKREVDFFLTKLIDGGLIFIHDTLPPTRAHLRKNRCSNAYLVRRELECRPDVNCFTWEYTAKNCGLSMVQKKPKSIVEAMYDRSRCVNLCQADA